MEKYFKIKRNETIFYVKIKMSEIGTPREFVYIYKPLFFFNIPIRKKLVYSEGINGVSHVSEDFYVKCINKVLDNYLSKPLTYKELKKLQMQNLSTYCKSTLHRTNNDYIVEGKRMSTYPPLNRNKK